jgi:hypothetical protein
MQNLRFESTGLAKPGDTRSLTGRGPGLACEELAGLVIGWVTNQIDLFLWSKPRWLADYPVSLLTLAPIASAQYLDRGEWNVFELWVRVLSEYVSNSV